MNRQNRRALEARQRQEQNQPRQLTPEEAEIVVAQEKVERQSNFVALIEQRLESLSKLNMLYGDVLSEYVDEKAAVISDIESADRERVDAQEKLCSYWEDFQRVADPDRMIQLAHTTEAL